MLCRQCLDAGNPGNHLELEPTGARGLDRLKDTDGAVVQRRVAPHQKTTTLAVGQFFIDQPFEGLLFGQVQVVDTGLVVHLTALTLGAVGFDKTVVVAGDVALADFAAQIDEFVFALALVHEKKNIDLIQRLHRLHRDVVGVAGTDPDDQEFFHHNSSSGSMPGKRSRQRSWNLNSMADRGSTSIRLDAPPCNTCVSAARMTKG
ncbi:hypothetical protein D3C85_832700 [compost metagenome]